MKFSNRLAVATSSCLSATSWASRMWRIWALLFVHELQQHVDGGNVGPVVVLDPLQLRDVADRADRGAADLACAFGQNIDAVRELVALLIEQEVVVAKMPAADMPMEVLGLHVENGRVRRGDSHKRYYGTFCRLKIAPQVTERARKSAPV